MNKFIFLSAEFYSDYPSDRYGEIERKDFRPYIQICVFIDGVQFAVPLRSNINHRFVQWTNKEKRCGLDFSKAVVITDDKYISNQKPFIRQDEFKALLGKEYVIEQKMRRFIRKYKQAKEKPHTETNQKILRYSTLQYFERYI